MLIFPYFASIFPSILSVNFFRHFFINYFVKLFFEKVAMFDQKDQKYEFENSVFSKVSSSYKKSYGMGLLLCLSKIVQIWLGFSQRCTFYVKNVAVKNMKKVLTVKNCALRNVQIIKIRFEFINLEFASEASFRSVKKYPNSKNAKIFVKLCLHSSLVVYKIFQIDELFDKKNRRNSSNWMELCTLKLKCKQTFTNICLPNPDPKIESVT